MAPKTSVMSKERLEPSGRSEPPTICIPSEADSRLSAMTVEVWRLEKALACMRAEKDAELKEVNDLLNNSENMVETLRRLDDLSRRREKDRHSANEKRHRADAVKISELTKKVSTLEKEVAHWQVKYARLEKDREEEQSQFSDERKAAQAEAKQKENEHQASKEQMVTYEVRIKDLVKAVNNSETRRQDERSSSDHVIQQHLDRRSQLEQTIANLERVVRDNEEKCVHLTRERNQQIQVTAQQRAEINSIEQAAEENTKQLRKYEERIVAYETRIDGLIAEAGARWDNQSQQPLDDISDLFDDSPDFFDGIPDLFEPNDEMVASPEPSNREASTEPGPEPVPSCKRKRVESSGHQQHPAHRRRFSSGQAVVPALSTNGTASASDADGTEHSASVRPSRRAAVAATRKLHNSIQVVQDSQSDEDFDLEEDEDVVIEDDSESEDVLLGYG
ncbi:hypothetical protein C8J56DRAFT_1043338 [Mycena floridula]|nr:hypothetical protein C8J56DRAFT_1043338 [Mycena floridula]